MPAEGIHSVTVPGAVDGWAKMHQRFGKLPWKDLFQPAIAYAEQGFPVAEAIDEPWTSSVRKLHTQEETSSLFLPGGKPPRVGDLFRNPQFTHALRLIAEQGRDAIYK